MGLRRLGSSVTDSLPSAFVSAIPQVLEVRGVSMGVNYGTGKVRFPAPVPVGSRVRGTAELTACDEVTGGVQTTIVITMEVEGGTKPACVVESLSRWLT